MGERERERARHRQTNRSRIGAREIWRGKRQANRYRKGEIERLRQTSRYRKGEIERLRRTNRYTVEKGK